MRLPLNCLIVALWLWGITHAKSWLTVRRSISFRGMIPHFGVVKEKDGYLTFIEYIPRQRKSALSSSVGQSFVLFDGMYKVRKFKQIGVGAGDTLKEAMRAVVIR